MMLAAPAILGAVAITSRRNWAVALVFLTLASLEVAVLVSTLVSL
jgi:hypothetical protein